MPVEDIVTGLDLRGAIHIDVRRQLDGTEASVVKTMEAWYRPSSGIHLDLNYAAVSVTWPRGIDQPYELGVLPFAARLQYRYFKPDGEFFFFANVFVGPSLLLTDSSDDRSFDDVLQGLSFGISLDFSGFEIGVGATWDWKRAGAFTNDAGDAIPREERFQLLIVMNVTEVIGKALGLISTPSSLIPRR